MDVRRMDTITSQHGQLRSPTVEDNVQYVELIEEIRLESRLRERGGNL